MFKTGAKLNKTEISCRVCLLTSTSPTSLFFKNEYISQSTNADLIMACATVKILENDGLPDVICCSCLDKLRIAYEFKQTCEKSDHWLKINYHEFSTHELVKSDYEHNEQDELSHESKLLTDTDGENIKSRICKNIEHTATELLNNSEKDIPVPSPTKKKCLRKRISRKEIQPKRAVKTIEKLPEVKNEKALYSCSKCDDTFKKKKLFLKHLRIKHKIKKLKCEICNETFETKKELKEHENEKGHEVKTKIPGYEKKCFLCNETFYRPKFWGRHRDTKHKDNKCTICGQAFRHFNYLMGHVETKHFIAPFLCPLCGLTLSEMRSLNTHINRVHLKITRHQCDQCDKRFFFPHQLRLHKVRIHENNRTFACDICDAKFKELARLRMHKLTHSVEGRYQCTECDKKFKTPVTFKRHKIWHTGVKKYVCEYCDKSFMFSKYLRQHLRIHTGEKPYVCKACNVGFAQSASLKYHKQNHHANDKKNHDVVLS